MRDRVGQQLGEYRLLRLIGRGSFAEVYVGEHLYLNRLDAIKVLLTQSMDFDNGDFLVEARTLANLKHPNIVRVLNFGISEGVPFLVLDYAPNGSLRQRHPKGTKLPLSTVASYVREVASALQYAHTQGLIHRDIKPENILLDGNNEILLSDFGLAVIARSTRSLILQDNAGTPLYVAPEQLKGKPRPASDQYSLGVVVYEWLCGECPFQGTTYELYSQHLFAVPPPLHEKNPATPLVVEQVVMRALEKDYHQRFASVQDFADALEHAIEQVGLFSSTELQLPAEDSASSESFSTSGPTLPLVPPVGPDVSRPAPQRSEAERVSILRPAVPVLSIPKQDNNAALPPSQPPPIPPQTRSERKFSRRTVGLGLATAAILVASGTGVFVWESFFNKSSSGASGLAGTSTSGSTPTSTPTPRPLGTTILTYSRHTDAVKAVAWSPDGKRIASASLDRTVQVWDATTGGHVLKYTGHTNQVKTVAWSPDGKLIASGGLDGTVQVWNATTGSHIYTYTGHSLHAVQAVRSVTWSPDSTRIASGAEDKTVQVWNATTGNLVLTYHGHASTVFSVAWSPDGLRIASGSDDLTVQVWDATTGKQSFIYRGHTMRVETVAWSPNSTRIASGGYDKTVQVWDAATGGKAFFLLYRGHKDVVEAVAWSPDGTRLASGSGGSHIDNTVQVWDAANGHLFFTYKAHSSVVWTVAWSPDGTRIASGSGSGGPQYIDNTVRVWQGK